MKRFLTAVLSAALLICTLPAAFAASDIQNHWAKSYIEALSNQGIMNPSSSTGEYKPNQAITRAEFMRYINRAFDFTQKSTISFADVAKADWYYETVQIAVAHGYINGVGNNKMDPNGTLTREQAATILGRLQKYTPTSSDSLLTSFKDSGTINSWSREYLADAIDNGYLNGYTDGTLKPQGQITRAEIAKILYFYMGTPLNTKSGVYTSANLQSTTKNVSITAPCTLSDTTVNGNLYITEGVLSGEVSLKNVNVSGRVIISGGAVTLDGVNTAQMVVSTPLGITPQVICSGNTNIGQTTVMTSASLSESNLSVSAGGLSDLTLSGSGLSLTLDGQVWTTKVSQPATILTTGGTEINELTADAKVTVSGGGSIQKAKLNATGCNLLMKPGSVELASGVTATIAGEEVKSSSSVSVSPAALSFDVSDTSSIAHSYDFTFNSDKNDLTKVVCNGANLKQGTDYALLTSQNGIRVYKTYLTTLSAGTYSMELYFEDGTKAAIAVSSINSALSAVSPSTVTFDKYKESANYADQSVTVTLPAGTTLSDVKIGSTLLTRGDDYTYASTSGLVTLKLSALASRSTGSYTVTFVPSRGSSMTCALTVVDTSPVNALSQSTADFDANTSSGGYTDLTVTLKPANGATLKYIRSNNKTLEENWQYQTNGNVITLSKSAVSSFATSGANYADFTFVMSSGVNPVLRVNYVTTYALTATVVDDLGNAISGASVTCTPSDAETGTPVQTVNTDSSGKAVFYVKRGSYTLKASDSRFTASVSATTSVTNARTVTLTGEILETVEITVTNSYGAKLSGAAVTIGGKIVNTGADGVATFRLKRSTYTAQIACQGYTSQSLAIIVKDTVRERVILK